MPSHFFYRNKIYSVKPLGCDEALGMSNKAISDGQISASSEWSDRHAANLGRLHFKGASGKVGSWSSRTNDFNQWLQVDLRHQHNNITRVATQGRHDHGQWVSKYKLQYSDDGVNFLYYKDQGQTTEKVKIISNPTD